MSWVERIGERPASFAERERIAAQHETFAEHAREAGIRDTAHNFAKWIDQQREAEKADGWRAIR